MGKANGGAGKENLSGVMGSGKHKVEKPYDLWDAKKHSGVVASAVILSGSVYTVGDHETGIEGEFEPLNLMGGRAVDTPPATETTPCAVVPKLGGRGALDVADDDVDYSTKPIIMVMGSPRI